VRELRNVIERLMIMVPGDTITAQDVPFPNRDLVAAPADGSAERPFLPLHAARDQFEQQYILRALATQQGNMSRTAEMLGVERSNLYRKMRAFGLVPPRRPEAEAPAEEEAS
jgi:two-component system nitrogen regulation response regulator NtrX